MDRLYRRRNPEPAPLRIFVSYRRGDSAAYAGRLYDALGSRFGEENVFMDVDAIELGSDFHEAIEAAISACDVAIALIGRNWLSIADEEGRRRLDDPEDVLRLELESALARDLVVIPACVQGAALPAPGELPPPLAPLARRQAAELRDTSWGVDVARLFARLEELAAERSRPPEPDVARRRGRRPRAFVPALVAAVVAIAAGSAMVLADGDGADRGSAASPVDERRLLSVIPQPLRSECAAIDWGPDAALASVECSGARLDVEYHLFESSSVLNAWYELGREDARVEPGSGSCTGSAFGGESAYTVEGEDAGRYFCFLDDDEPHLVWTDERAAVGADAHVWEGTGRPAAESLLRQWRCCLELLP